MKSRKTLKYNLPSIRKKKKKKAEKRRQKGNEKNDTAIK
jgi:hypothetical protein